MERRGHWNSALGKRRGRRKMPVCTCVVCRVCVCVYVSVCVCVYVYTRWLVQGFLYVLCIQKFMQQPAVRKTDLLFRLVKSVKALISLRSWERRVVLFTTKQLELTARALRLSTLCLFTVVALASPLCFDFQLHCGRLRAQSKQADMPIVLCRVEGLGNHSVRPLLL